MVQPTHTVLGIAAGIGLGAILVQPLSAEMKGPTTYLLIENYDITDQPGFAKRAQANGAALAANGGRFLARGATPTAISGSAPSHMSIVAFDSADQAAKFLTSAEFRKSDADIQKVAPQTKTFFVEGLKP